MGGRRRERESHFDISRISYSSDISGKLRTPPWALLHVVCYGLHGEPMGGKETKGGERNATYIHTMAVVVDSVRRHIIEPFFNSARSSVRESCFPSPTLLFWRLVVFSGMLFPSLLLLLLRGGNRGERKSKGSPSSELRAADRHPQNLFSLSERRRNIGQRGDQSRRRERGCAARKEQRN